MYTPTSPWWKRTVFYQIYPRSFLDTNGDGIGDLQGIISKLDYLRDLGIGAIWLSPVYTSPNNDYGYDIADYYTINPEYGTLDDMKRLIREAKSRGIRIVMDVAMNHTSSQHKWFQASRDPSSPYRDFYIWKKPQKGLFGRELPPNNWTSVFSGSAWQKDEISGEYYLHLFTKEQPDLNYRNPRVLEEIEKVLNFWLDLGVAGFRCDVFNLLHKSTFRDGRFNFTGGGREYYSSVRGLNGIIKKLHADVFGPRHAFTVGETFGTPSARQAKKFTAGDEVDTIFTFDMNISGLTLEPGAKRLKRATLKWQHILDWNTIFIENHDQNRAVSIFGNDTLYRNESAKMLAVFVLTLRGTPFIYQGQEIGMTNVTYKHMEETKDPMVPMVYRMIRGFRLPRFVAEPIALFLGRDHARTPMQWTDEAHAGFSTTEPWLAENPNYTSINVAQNLRDETSIYHFYRRLIALRSRIPALVDGTIRFKRERSWVLHYTRYLGNKHYAVVMNLSAKPQKVRGKVRGEVVMTNYSRTELDGRLLLEPYEAIIYKK